MRLVLLSSTSMVCLCVLDCLGVGRWLRIPWWKRGKSCRSVTTCDDVRFFFSFFFIYHVYFYSRSHDWRSSFRTWLIGSHTLLSHVTHRLMTHVDSGWLIVTHRCFTLCCFIYICFIFCFMTHTRTPIVLVTYCSRDVHCSCDVYCSRDTIVPTYYKVRPSK